MCNHAQPRLTTHNNANHTKPRGTMPNHAKPSQTTHMPTHTQTYLCMPMHASTCPQSQHYSLTGTHNIRELKEFLKIRNG